jgi:hypothetical protein
LNSAFDYQSTNPFSTSAIAPSQVMYRFAPGRQGTSKHGVNQHLEELLATLKASRRGLIVGPHGTGKSTLLHTFLPKLQQSYPKVAFEQLVQDPTLGIVKRLRQQLRASKRIRRELAGLAKGGLLIIDGWEQLGPLARWQIMAKASAKQVTLLATAHRHLPGWTVLFETGASLNMVRSLANDLLHDSPFELRKLVDDWLKDHGVTSRTNVRELWFKVYDLVEDARQSETRERGTFWQRTKSNP